jgi:hypothetical protein
MAMHKQGKYWYGESPDDTREAVVRYSRENGYEATRFCASTCECGGRTFKLETDEEAGAARRVCAQCDQAVLMGDSAQYADEADFDNHVCVCGEEKFDLLCAVALYEDSNDVRWFYIGCKCTKCNLVGVFADWKCEAGDADEFLAKT